MLQEFRVAGFDPAIGGTMAYAIVDENEQLIHTDTLSLKRNGGSYPERFQRITHFVTEMFDNWHPQMVMVEKPFVNPKAGGASVVGLSAAYGAIFAALYAVGAEDVREVLASQWQPAITGIKRPSKKDTAAIVNSRLGLGGVKYTPDETDAMAIAVYGLIEYRLSQYRKE
jgi:Holliday junction resolvasome RuvABC endonuclease subunit